MKILSSIFQMPIRRVFRTIHISDANQACFRTINNSDANQACFSEFQNHPTAWNRTCAMETESFVVLSYVLRSFGPACWKLYILYRFVCVANGDSYSTASRFGSHITTFQLGCVTVWKSWWLCLIQSCSVIRWWMVMVNFGMKNTWNLTWMWVKIGVLQNMIFLDPKDAHCQVTGLSFLMWNLCLPVLP